MPTDPLEAWRESLGAEHVLTDRAVLAAAERATFATTQRIRAILRPADTGQVRTCLRIANEHRLPVYPVSRGKNWGFGSRVPVRDDSVVIQLDRLDAIVGYDRRLGVARVQTGVTFRGLAAFLAENGGAHFASVTGGSPDASVLATALERGDGTGPYGDLFAHLGDLEVVLPSGACIHTGLSRFEGSLAAGVHRYGVGPFLDGLFSQSNLGIVTEASVQVAPRPAEFHNFFACVDRRDGLDEMVTRMARLVAEGTVPSTVFFWNDYKALSAARQFPFAGVPRPPLPPEHVARFTRRWFGGAWNVTGALYSPSRRQARAARLRLVALLRPGSSRLAVVGRHWRWQQRWVLGLYTRLTGRDTGGLQVPAEGNPFLGVPSERNLRTAYWRKKDAPPAEMDLDRDRCGFLWVTATVPFVGEAAARATALAEERIAAHGFEPSVGMIGISPRCLYLIAALAYDRDVAGEDERAHACHDATLRTLMQAGYPPFRLGLQSMAALPASRDDYDRLLATLKEALDPHGILAPGRYVPS